MTEEDTMTEEDLMEDVAAAEAIKTFFSPLRAKQQRQSTFTQTCICIAILSSDATTNEENGCCGCAWGRFKNATCAGVILYFYSKRLACGLEDFLKVCLYRR